MAFQGVLDVPQGPSRGFREITRSFRGGARWSSGVPGGLRGFQGVPRGVYGHVRNLRGLGDLRNVLESFKGISAGLRGLHGGFQEVSGVFAGGSRRSQEGFS